jgi:hypothetical protein
MCFPAAQAKPVPNDAGPPNKSKLFQGKPRKKTWISLDSFGRIGTYQWVTANPNEKNLFSCHTAPSRRKRLFSSPLRMDWREIDPAIGKKLAHDFCFFNKNTEGSDLQAD